MYLLDLIVYSRHSLQLTNRIYILVMYHQHIRSLFDMLGVCRLPWIELGFHEDFYAEIFSAVVGKEYSLEELLKKSQHLYHMTRAINVKLGSTRSDDYPPDRTFAPIHSGPLAGRCCDRDEYDNMLSLYFQKRGWDWSPGLPLCAWTNSLAGIRPRS